MREIVISAADWKTPDDFYADLLRALEAPAWHGHNLDALWDSITGGDISGINPPFRIRIAELDRTTESCREIVEKLVNLIRDAHAAGFPVEIICNA